MDITGGQGQGQPHGIGQDSGQPDRGQPGDLDSRLGKEVLESSRDEITHLAHKTSSFGSSLSSESSTTDLEQCETLAADAGTRRVTGRTVAWSWIIEIILCVTSLASLIVIIALLEVYDDKPRDSMDWPITLNTFLAFFTTLTRATFMVAVLESMSQWKWISLKKGELSLKDFLLMDSASRSVYGSIQVALRLHYKHIITLGAIVSLFGIITSPFTQQMIQYPVRSSVNPTGSASVTATDYYFHPVLGGEDFSKLNLNTVGTMVYDPPKDLGPDCSSSYCTYPTFKSLGVCAHVANVTSFLTTSVIHNSDPIMWTMGDSYKFLFGFGESTTAWNATLPNGASHVTPVSYSYSSYATNTSLFFTNDTNLQSTALNYIYLIWSNAGNVTYPGFNTTSSSSSTTPPWRFEAVEIVLNLCVQTYTASYRQPTASITPIATSYTPANIPNNTLNLAMGCYMFQTTYSCYEDDAPPANSNLTLVSDEQELFAADAPSVNMLSHYMAYNTQQMGSSNGVGMYVSGQNDWFLTEALYGKFDYPEDGLRTDPVAQLKALEVFYQGTATVLSNYFRSVSNQSVNGTSWQDEVYVHIRWEWLTLLVAQLLIAVAFLLVTILCSHSWGVPVLKSEILAPLLASSEEVRCAMGDIGDLPAAQRRADRLGVRLEDNRILLSKPEG
ncbi:hypothetical protein B0T22DRAFT_440752 [Podospora appendiculata]|uniref:Uncharacterized protein n=1 Tax=Podospora appendiculata TaxID=314037 RepID=A0AAE1CD59_9PEZI|nr:hypothetical protein B0T22DRAFT_440752 [Podospora appendiculata]